MTIHIVNNHQIDVPDDMRVNIESGYAGAYDHITYRGAEICIFEQENEEPAYTGKFAVFFKGDDLFVDNLADARTAIDRMVAA